MANTKVQSEQIEDGAITAAKIADGAIVASEVADNAITTAKINADAVTGAKIADNAIDSEHYTDGSIDTAHIADSQVTSAKIDTNIDIAGTFDVTGATTLDSTLAVAGVTTITTADNLDTLSLISTDADANVAPNLRMYRNSGSPADSDQLGKILLVGRNDNSQDVIYAQIGSQIKDASDGTEDGRVFINSIVGGTTVSRIDMTEGETVFNNDTVDLDFRVESDNLTHALFVQGSDGNVGIGNSSPSSYESTARQLVVGSGSGSNGITIASASDGLSRLFFADGTSGGQKYDSFIAANHTDSALIFGTGATGGEDMRIGATGELQLGGTTNSGFIDFDSQNLQLNTQRNPNTGAFSNTSKSHASIQLNGASGGSSILFGTASANNTVATTKMRIDSSGKVGINVTPSTDWDGNSVLQMSHGSFHSSSSFGAGVSTNLAATSSGWAAKHIATGAGSLYLQATSDGGHRFYTIASASAGASATVTERMRIHSVADDATLKITQSSETGGQLLIRSNYSDPHYLATQGTNHSSGGWYWGYGVQMSGSGTTKSTFSNFNGSRSFVQLFGDRIQYNFAGAQNTTIGNAVSLTESVRIDAQGIKFNGDTGTANALDDYEEGTWSPNLIRNGGSTAATFSASAAYAKYTKIGRFVFLQAFFTGVSDGSSDGSSYWRINGVPFAGSAYTGTMLGYNSLSGATGAYIGDAGGNLILTNGASAYTGSLGSGKQFMLMFTYETST